jgi:hypothetical protein
LPEIIEPAAAEPSAIRPQSVTTAEPVTRAPRGTLTVDDDHDRPREPRIHTISLKTYEDRGDGE